MEIVNIDLIPAKQCNKCKMYLPATLEYFYKGKRGKYGLVGKCKICYRSKYIKVVKLIIINEIVGKTCTKCLIWYPATIMYWGKSKKSKYGLHSICKNCIRVSVKKYSLLNKEKLKKYIKNWAIKNSKIMCTNVQRRNARKKGLPDTFTFEQYNVMYEYFDSKCVVCNSIEKLHMDHWIPLMSEHCPGTVASNIILLCQHCNLSKGSKPFGQWLMQKFNNGYFALAVYIKVFNYFKSLP